MLLLMDRGTPQDQRYGQIRVEKRFLHQSYLQVRGRYLLDSDQTIAHSLDMRSRCGSPHRMGPKDCVPRSKPCPLYLADTPRLVRYCKVGLQINSMNLP